ncbi:MAG: BamA/TamA family outer membrane protein [Proteobacteria bacterium]|nr:BamA/TamA family outer membrane protein [Pseudomonadota bacterium]
MYVNPTKTYLIFSLVFLTSIALAKDDQLLQPEPEKQIDEEAAWVVDAISGEHQGDNYFRMGSEYLPDLREEEGDFKLQKGDLVIVPIPISNPTLDTGLVVGGAYFYPQTAEQKDHQPPSVTGAAVFRSSNGSAAFGVGHKSYLDGNKWRLGGVFGHADLDLVLRNPTDGEIGSQSTIGWNVRGGFMSARVSRKVSGDWYVGIKARYLDMRQIFSINLESNKFDFSSSTKTVGVGLAVEYDSTDKPLNSYSGKVIEIDAFLNSTKFGSDQSYQSYGLKYRSYHLIAPSVVLAWEAQACARSDTAPLWDACRINLRGFSSVAYLGTTSTSAQVEARWQFHRKWGAVAFAGGGLIKNPFTELSDRQVIPSYGIGLRFMLLESQRINFRLDYARSINSDAFYISVGEAF